MLSALSAATSACALPCRGPRRGAKRRETDFALKIPPSPWRSCPLANQTSASLPVEAGRGLPAANGVAARRRRQLRLHFFTGSWRAWPPRWIKSAARGGPKKVLRNPRSGEGCLARRRPARAETRFGATSKILRRATGGDRAAAGGARASLRQLTRTSGRDRVARGQTSPAES